MRAFEQAVVARLPLSRDRCPGLTADGVVVVFHDEDLSRLCGRPGRISELPAAEVAARPGRRHRADPDPRRPARRLARRAFQHRLQERRRRPAARRRDHPPRALDRVCLTSFSDRRVRALRRLPRATVVHGGRRTWELTLLKLTGVSPPVPWRPRCRCASWFVTVVTAALRPSLPSSRRCRPRVDDRRRRGDAPAARPRCRRDHDRPPGGAARRARRYAAPGTSSHRLELLSLSMTARHVPFHTVRGSRWVVAAADQLATQAGMWAFARGGNAVDAAIAANAAIAVTGPHLCGMGGDLFAIVSHPRRRSRRAQRQRPGGLGRRCRGAARPKASPRCRSATTCAA